MPDDQASEPKQACQLRGAPATLATFIPRFGDQPSYRIFECDACKALTWIAEKISD